MPPAASAGGGGPARCRSPVATVSYFFYGTLMDADVRAAVIGRRDPAPSAELALLRGYRRVCMRGASYPVLVPAADDVVDGLLVRGLDDDDERRLIRFEGGAYRRAEVTVEGRWSGRVGARCFLPMSIELADNRPWDAATWRRRHRAGYLVRIRRVPVAAG